MKQSAVQASNNRTEETRILAHRLWEEAGCPWGKDFHFWLMAERQLLQERQESVHNLTKSSKKSAVNKGAKVCSKPPIKAR